VYLLDKDMKDIKHFELYCLPEMEGYYKQFCFESLQDLNFMRLKKK